MTTPVKLESQKFGAGGKPLTAKRESLWMDASRRLIRNRAAVIGGGVVLLLILIALFAPVIAVKSFEVQVLTDQNKVPEWMLSIFPTMKPYVKISEAYPLGADYVGRDLFSRIVYGTRVSLTIAFVGPLISLIIGVIYGSISGYFGGRVDNIMMRIVEECSYGDISRCLECGEATVRAHVRQGRLRLVELLKHVAPVTAGEEAS